VSEPLGTVTAKGQHFGLVEPIMIESDGTLRKASVPIPEIAGTGTIGLVEPYLIHVNHHGGDRVRSVNQPLPTVCGNRGEMAMCEPFLLKKVFEKS
jgi:DNA (cytosine-5)-methyltransferase 1